MNAVHGMRGALTFAMLRRWLTGMAAVTLAGCVCSSDPVTETAYASMARYPTELSACILHQGCSQLCQTVFLIGDAEIQRCELVAFDGHLPGASPGKPLTADDLWQIRGGTVRVTYVPNVCEDSSSAEDGGYDGSTDDGSTDDGSTDDGSTDDGSTDDGSTDDGSTDDGSTDDGSTDDGSTDDGGWSPLRLPPPAARFPAGQPANQRVGRGA